MTCVPDGIIKSLTDEDFHKLNMKPLVNAKDFMKSIKKYNKPTPNITIQGI